MINPRPQTTLTISRTIDTISAINSLRIGNLGIRILISETRNLELVVEVETTERTGAVEDNPEPLALMS